MFPIIPIPAYHEARIMASRGQQQQQQQPASGVSRRKSFLLSDILINVQSFSKATRVAVPAAATVAASDDCERATNEIKSLNGENIDNSEQPAVQQKMSRVSSNSCLNDEQASSDSVDIDVTAESDTGHSDGEDIGAKVSQVVCSSIRSPRSSHLPSPPAVVGQGHSQLSFGIDRLLRPDNLPNSHEIKALSPTHRQGVNIRRQSVEDRGRCSSSDTGTSTNVTGTVSASAVTGTNGIAHFSLPHPFITPCLLPAAFYPQLPPLPATSASFPSEYASFGFSPSSFGSKAHGPDYAELRRQSKRKKTWSRAVFSNLQRKGLEKRFEVQKYVTKPDRRQLAAMLGLTDAQVKVWFQNRRMKWRHQEEVKKKKDTLHETSSTPGYRSPDFNSNSS